MIYRDLHTAQMFIQRLKVKEDGLGVQRLFKHDIVIKNLRELCARNLHNQYGGYTRTHIERERGRERGSKEILPYKHAVKRKQQKYLVRKQKQPKTV